MKKEKKKIIKIVFMGILFGFLWWLGYEPFFVGSIFAIYLLSCMLF